MPGGFYYATKRGCLTVAKGKYEYWRSEDGLLLLAAWARDGLTDEQIAERMRIHPSTLYDYKRKHSEISEALKKGKEVVDIEVENELLKKTKGFIVKLKKTFKVKVPVIDDAGRKIADREELQTGIDEVYVPADTTAQIFWLKNRKPKEWRDKPDDRDSQGQEVTIIDDL